MGQLHARALKRCSLGSTWRHLQLSFLRIICGACGLASACQIRQQRCWCVPAAIPPEDHLIPFKESKLTKLLKESLCGNAVLLVLCCLSPAAEDHADTLGTLQFAQACKSLHATPQVSHSCCAGQPAQATALWKLPCF